jgi:glucan phosphorylase
MKRSVALLTPRFSTTRMVREYVGRYYLAARAGQPGEPAASS